MTKTYNQLQKQIEALSRDADRLKKNEIKDVIARIKEAIDTYGLTAADLGLGARRGSKRAVQKKAVKAAKAVKFRDGDGNTWVGRGPRPQWLRDALASGKSLEDFAV